MEFLMKVITKYILLVSCLLIALPASAIEIDKTASVKDTSTSIIGLNHIGLSVKDLDSMLAFYLKATNFELVKREQVRGNEKANKLFGHEDIVYEIAVLKGPNMLLELTEFKQNEDATTGKMLPEGPGMTHTCFQSPATDSGWDKFITAGIEPLSRGGKPIDLGGYGVTYGYAYDPEGNMLELEQLDAELLARSGYDGTWQDVGENLWMSQVGLASADIARLMGFYEKVLGFKPYRLTKVSENEKLDEIVNIDNVELIGGWFKLNEASKVIEIWQYLSPVTPESVTQTDITALGYSFSIEVTDIQGEYQRLTDLGLEFVSEPVQFGDFWQVYSRDLDGNIFSLRQAVDPDSRFSVIKMDVRNKRAL